MERIELTTWLSMFLFLGYIFEHKDYRCWNLVAHRLRVFCVVTFFEHMPYYSLPLPTSLFLIFMSHAFPDLYFPLTETFTSNPSLHSLLIYTPLLIMSTLKRLHDDSSTKAFSIATTPLISFSGSGHTRATMLLSVTSPYAIVTTIHQIDFSIVALLIAFSKNLVFPFNHSQPL